ncbi:DUF4276 family protein [Duganella sp. FT94W]|uniref:DUF4276 family protein n=1 Tax=Duganella lactea TaxID=2692173 RepID=A0ABW9V4G7_9BURK|nr:DUF4276 family protein [Duganella lactea]MYM33608.1 DUF4276 family protein [Duganella lactea]
MINVVPIVEGDGEVKALPVLLRRLNEWLSPATWVNVVHPIRVRRDQFLNKEEEFLKKIRIAARLCGEHGWILILLDADDDCPRAMAQHLREKVEAAIPGHHLSVVFANHEYEAWFIAAARSLNGRRGFVCDGPLPEAEGIRGAKEWMSKHFPKGAYHPVQHQPGLSASMDLQQAYDNSRSFRKLCNDWRFLMARMLN